MNRIKSAGVVALSAIAISTVGLTVPASAHSPTEDTQLSCTYRLSQQTGKVSGTCSGTSPLGAASGSYEGKLRPGAHGKGSFTLNSELGTLRGSFRGDNFNGGLATGCYTVKLGTITLTGGFVAGVIW